MKNTFVDAHLHLQDPRFSGILEEVLDRAAERGVSRLFCNAVDERDWPAIGDLAERHAAVVPFMGIHPGLAGPFDRSGRVTATLRRDRRDRS